MISSDIKNKALALIKQRTNESRATYPSTLVREIKISITDANKILWELVSSGEVIYERTILCDVCESENYAFCDVITCISCGTVFEVNEASVITDFYSNSLP